MKNQDLLRKFKIVNSDKPRKNKENRTFFVFVLSANQGQKMKLNDLCGCDNTIYCGPMYNQLCNSNERSKLLKIMKQRFQNLNTVFKEVYYSEEKSMTSEGCPKFC